MGSMSLFLLAAEYRAAADRLAELDLDEQTVADTLDSLAGDLQTKAVSVAAVARNLEATADAIRDAEKAMADRRKALERRAEGLRAYLLRNMLDTGIKRIECPQFVMAVKASPPAVDVFDAAQVPAEFMRQPEPPPAAPDKVAIRDALKAGQDVPGARLVTGQRLEIR